MGAIWLLSMPQVLRDAGLTVDVYPGWQTRSRSSGGYDAIHGIQVHHTASNTKPENDMGYMWNNAPARPIGAIYLARDGRVTVGAAGATNTSGRGGPLGPIPLDQANKYVISIEAANLGNGEVWPEVQQAAYLKLVNALVLAYGLDFTVPGVHAHHEWTTRKVDPAGPSRWAFGANKWDMNGFRFDAKSITKPIPLPPPEQSIFEEEEIMVALIIVPPPEAGPNPPWLLHINGSTTYIGSAAYKQAIAKGIPQVQHNMDQYSNYRAAAGC